MENQDFVDNMLKITLGGYLSGQLHDDEFAGFRRITAPVRLILDVGANRGQSIATLKVLFPDAIIHTFEANPLYAPVLEGLQTYFQGTVHVHGFGLGSQDATIPLYVPWVLDTPFLEESSTRLDYYEKPWVAQKFRERGGLRLEKQIVDIRRGDDLGLAPDVIKIDVEGAEHDVLIGLRETILRHTPTLFVENSDYNNVTPYLSDLGYSPYRWIGDDLVPYYGESPNTFYIHNSVRFN